MAIEHIQQKIIQKNMQIKIIFMDCNMPDLDGFQTSKLIMDLCKKHEVQMPYIFALTAYSKDNK
jgi:CheY-like chemotaxis protein